MSEGDIDDDREGVRVCETVPDTEAEADGEVVKVADWLGVLLGVKVSLAVDDSDPELL